MQQDWPDATPPDSRSWSASTLCYVPGQNFLVSQPILTILGALESTGSLLSKTLKIIEIGSEMTKFWSQTYATVTSLESRRRRASYQIYCRCEYLPVRARQFGMLVLPLDPPCAIKRDHNTLAPVHSRCINVIILE